MSHAHGEIDWQDALFSRHFLWDKSLATLYVVAIPISHFALPHSWVWGIAVFFLIAMLFTYPLAAHCGGAHVSSEMRVSLGLAVVGVIGFFLSPWLIIAGVFGHGVWDLMKHKGVGAPFFGWYVSGCVVVDWTYATALTVYYLTGST